MLPVPVFRRLPARAPVQRPWLRQARPPLPLLLLLLDSMTTRLRSLPLAARGARLPLPPRWPPPPPLLPAYVHLGGPPSEDERAAMAAGLASLLHRLLLHWRLLMLVLVLVLRCPWMMRTMTPFQPRPLPRRLRQQALLPVFQEPRTLLCTHRPRVAIARSPLPLPLLPPQALVRVRVPLWRLLQHQPATASASPPGHCCWRHSIRAKTFSSSNSVISIRLRQRRQRCLPEFQLLHPLLLRLLPLPRQAGWVLSRCWNGSWLRLRPRVPCRLQPALWHTRGSRRRCRLCETRNRSLCHPTSCRAHHRLQTLLLPLLLRVRVLSRH